MDQKVILVLVDGMRADSVKACGNAYVEELLASGTSTLSAQTVTPSVTLPCHMSLLHSVDPDRHGIVTNLYTPQVRPIEGLFERLDIVGKKSSMFYTWEELRDLSRPDHLHRAVMFSQHKDTNTDQKITTAAISYINEEAPDFMFLYLGETDEVGGHSTGWMSETYLGCVSNAIDCVKRLREGISAEYNVILVADHGGHDRSHGSDRPEDMTIPVLMNGPAFEAGKTLEGVSIKDIAPTIAKMLGATPAREWEGKALI